MSEKEMDLLRQGIDELDQKIVDILNERAKLANKIGDLKKVMKLPVFSPKREDDVMSNVMGHNKGPLPGNAIRRIFERIIDETRRLEREHMDESETPA